MKLQDRKGILTMKSVYKIRTNYTNICLFLMLFLLLPYAAKAEAPKPKAHDYSRSQKEELLCRQIQDKINNKQEIRTVVRTGIQMGYNACGVIKCAIKAGGDLRQSIEGAVEAGTTKDVVSRCAIDAGADSREVAAILNSIGPAICYILPEVIDSPPEGRRGGFLSPSGFK